MKPPSLSRPSRASAILAAAGAALACLGACASATPAAAHTAPVQAMTAARHPAAANPCGRVTKPPAYKHVIVIMDENQSYGDIIGNTAQAPYINSLARDCGLATNDHNITHHSLANYIAITSGLSYPSLEPFYRDCVPSPSCETSATSIFRQASSWKEYAEGMPSNCYQAHTGDYVPRHNPAVYYTSLPGCGTDDVPLGTTSDSPLLKDFGSESTAPAYSYLTGNLCDDMHGATGCKTDLIAHGDAWLSTWIRLITSTPVYQSGDTAMFLTWDEGSGGTTGEKCYDNTSDQSCHVATIVIAPSVKPGTVVSTQFDHWSVLKTAEQLLGLSPLGQAKSAKSMLAGFNL